MTYSQIDKFLQVPLFRSNTVKDLLEAIAVFAASMLVLWVCKIWLLRRIRKAAAKTKTGLDDFLIDLFARAILPILFIGSTYFAISSLDLTKSAHKFVNLGFKGLLIIQVVRLFMSVLTYLVQNSWLKTVAPGSMAAKSALGLIRFILWSVAVIFLIDNLGFDVNSVVAGLGIGGVAVALAAQTILGDLFNYFVITFDRPFVEGDFIVVDDFMGEIEKIGIKSTRIRSLSGEQLIISNTNLTSSRIKNFKRMQRRRASFTIGVVYQTPAETMRRIPAMIRRIIESQPETTFDRAHFRSFADSSLEIETVYFVNAPEFNKFMDIQQAINLAIMENFEKERIEFAYPTQTVFEHKIAGS